MFSHILVRGSGIVSSSHSFMKILYMFPTFIINNVLDTGEEDLKTSVHSLFWFGVDMCMSRKSI